jgi:hypothetical protein
VTALTEFRRYHVLMRHRGKLGFLPWPKISFFPMWGTRIEVGRWVVFEREALKAAFNDKWTDDLIRVIERGLFVVDGEDERGKRHRLTPTDAHATPEVEEASSPGRPGGSGLNVRVYHLRTVMRLEYDDILDRLEGDPQWLTQLEAWGQVRQSRLAGLRRMNADGREPHAKWCLPCNEPERERKTTAAD